MQGKGLNHFSADFGNLALQRTHARLAGVITDDVEASLRRKLNLIRLEAIQLGLLWNQITQRYIQFLVFGVARNPDNLHAIEEWPGNIHGVRSAHKHHIRQIVVDFEVVIIKRMILLGIEHLEHGRGRIPSVVHTHLVDFVQQKQWVSHARLGHLL